MLDLLDLLDLLACGRAVLLVVLSCEGNMLSIGHAVTLFAAMLLGLLVQRSSVTEVMPELESKTKYADSMLSNLKPVLLSAGKVARI